MTVSSWAVRRGVAKSAAAGASARSRRDARPCGGVTKSRAARDSLGPVLDLDRGDAARLLTCGLGADAVPSHTSRRAAVGLEPAAVLQQQQEGLGLGAEAELARELILRDEVEAVIAEELVVDTPDWGAGRPAQGSGLGSGEENPDPNGARWRTR